jgi:hypothetical protein
MGPGGPARKGGPACRQPVRHSTTAIKGHVNEFGRGGLPVVVVPAAVRAAAVAGRCVPAGGFGNLGRQPVPRAQMTGRGRATGARPAPAHWGRIRRYSRLPASAGFDGYSRVSACLIDLVDRFLVAVPGTHDGGDVRPEQLCAGRAEASKVLTGRPAVRASRGSLGDWLHVWEPGAAAGLGGCFVCSRRRRVHAAFRRSSATDCAQL